MCRVEVYAVTLSEHDDLVIDGYLKDANHDNDELLPIVNVLSVVFAVGQRFNLGEERLHRPSLEAAGQRLVLVVVVAVHLQTHASTGNEVAVHARLFTIEKHIKGDTILLGNAREAIDTRIALAVLYATVVLHACLAHLRHLLHRDVEYLAQPFQALRYLFDVVHIIHVSVAFRLQRYEEK